MPPKPQVFKSPDGLEFSTKSEWRDYMMATFYSFKNKSNEKCEKLPGSIDGQMFDIADCVNSSLIILDHTEQVQIDQLNGCRVFIGACASSIFIRNCKNCVFYTCCRQLRLRDVENCTFYIYSMSEVHIEYSTGLFFAPFNGGYVHHKEHLRIANLDVKQNLWYDIYDHNDAAKTHQNWNLLPKDKYEMPWFPLGDTVDFAIPIVEIGSVQKPIESNGMQSFSLPHMNSESEQTKHMSEFVADAETELVAIVEKELHLEVDPISSILDSYVAITAGTDVSGVLDATCVVILPNGGVLSATDFAVSAPLYKRSVCNVNKTTWLGENVVVVVFSISDASLMTTTVCSAVLQRNAADDLRIMHVHTGTPTKNV